MQFDSNHGRWANCLCARASQPVRAPRAAPRHGWCAVAAAMRPRRAGPGGRVARGALVALAAFAAGARAYPTSSDDVPRGTASSLPYSDYHTLPATPGTPTPGAAGVSQWATAFDGEDGFLAAARAAARGDAEDITGGSPEYSKLPPPAYAGLAATAWPMFGGGVMHKGRQDVFDPGYLVRALYAPSAARLCRVARSRAVFALSMAAASFGHVLTKCSS